MSEVKVKIILDGVWTEIPYEELKNYKFDECIIEEKLTKAEWYKFYFEFYKPCPH